MIRRPPRSTQSRSSAASDVYKRQVTARGGIVCYRAAAASLQCRPMADDDARARRARFLRELAARDLYAWFGIPPDAGADAIRAAAEAKRRELSGTPMPQKTRAIEKAFCDQGEKALLRPDIRREYDALLHGARSPARAMTSAQRVVAEREERLRLSLIHISEPTRRTPISYAVFCLK